MPIQKKLMHVMFRISGVVLLVTCISFFVYEFYTFRKSTLEKLSTIGNIISANSTAALAFDDHEGAKEILSALKTEPHIVAACLYDKDNNLFSVYPANLSRNAFPAKPDLNTGYHFSNLYVEGFQPVLQDSRTMGTLYLRSDLGAMYDRLKLYLIVVVFVAAAAFLLAYFFSKILQRNISKPILSLAKTAKAISDEKDYSLRAAKSGKDELGSLTDAFNNMLAQIEEQNQTLNSFNQNLEQKVTERTIELETVNRDLESFSYSISHDLRAPLRNVIGFTTILEEEYDAKLDTEGKRITGIIKSSTAKMGNLIDDLLAFSRLGRQTIKKSDINTDLLVKEIIDNSGAKETNPTIEWKIQPLFDMKADINTIRQVWINLISNAIKYSGKKENPKIEIGSFMKNGQTVFFVKDNGVGFDEKYKSKLFKVFQRLHNNDEFEGTGIGLAIVEKIISKHGGSVWAEAELDKGSTFYFSLPFE